MTWKILGALMVMGCSTVPAGAEPLPVEDFHAALSVWHFFEQDFGHCGRYAGEGDVLVIVVDDTRELCYQDVSGCLTSASEGLFDLEGWWPLIVQRYDDAGPHLVAHELTHLLAGCSGHRNGRDRMHSREVLWGENGVSVTLGAVLKGDR